MVWAPGHPMAQASGYAYEHRVVYYDSVDRIGAETVVHHKNEVKTDNEPTNLRGLPRSKHGRVHCDSARGRELALLSVKARRKRRAD